MKLLHDGIKSSDALSLIGLGKPDNEVLNSPPDKFDKAYKF